VTQACGFFAQHLHFNVVPGSLTIACISFGIYAKLSASASRMTRLCKQSRGAASSCAGSGTNLWETTCGL